MSFSQNPNVEEVVPANGLAVGFKGGRPPDEVADEVVNILERSRSPVPEVAQPLLKRGRNLEEAMLIDDESGQVVPEGVVLIGDGSQVQAAADGLSAPSIPSFKDKLVGFKVVNRRRRQGAAIPNREPRNDTSIANGGSRFAVLEEEGNELGGEVVVSKQPEEKVEGAAWNGRGALGGGRGRVRIISRSPSPKKDEADRLKVANIGGSGTQSVREVGARLEAGSLGRETSLVAAQGLVMPVKPSMVADMVSATGDWDWNRLREFLPEEVLDHLAATPPPLPHLGEDVLGWRWDAKQEFRVSSAYSFLMHEGERIRNSKWTRIWSLKVPQRISITCCVDVEKPKNFGGMYLGGEAAASLDSLPFEEWLHGNISCRLSAIINRADWDMEFVIYVWLLWKLRCSMVLDLSFVERDSVWDRGRRLFLECKAIAAATARGPAVGLSTDARWTFPPRGWIKSKLGQRGSMQGCRLATPPTAIAIAVAEEKCHGRVGFESAVVDIEGSGSVDGSGLAVMD
ncbi:hypothetical protein V6N11_036352 [Hibiscus sabdariffa]|uniref:Uncharacterized protein n=1 Tax=Hibiscus sabdariffa TaxID=183260 RepID=A0ABR2RA57_9ROSI